MYVWKHHGLISILIVFYFTFADDENIICENSTL